MVERKYSICILTLNHIDITQKCLLSVMNTEFDGSAEIIIVDNGSTDGTAEWLKSFQDKYDRDECRIVLVLNKYNRGCTGGRNQACRMATGEFIVLLDNDAEVIDSKWLSKLYEFYISKGQDVGIVGPKMVYPQNPGMIQQIGLGVTANGKIGYWGQGKNTDDPLYNESRELQGYPAACWLIRRKIFEEYGYFDEVYYPVNLEDVDFCYRIREKGLKIYYCPFVVLYHHEHITTKNTEDLSFMRVTLKNGKIFKERWRHMYEEENGMKLEDIHWEY